MKPRFALSFPQICISSSLYCYDPCSTCTPELGIVRVTGEVKQRVTAISQSRMDGAFATVSVENRSHG
jgi:hypothetical protein